MGAPRGEEEEGGWRKSCGSRGGRKGGWPVGRPMGCGLAGGGEGGYDRWA
jgi:hypothetical protein